MSTVASLSLRLRSCHVYNNSDEMEVSTGGTG